MHEPRLQILIVDDQQSSRDRIRGLLRDLVPDAHISIVGTAMSGMQLAFMRSYDLMIVDVHLPDGSGLDLVRQVKLVRPTANVLVLSNLPRDPYERAALQSGASAYVVKRDATYLLGTAVLALLDQARSSPTGAAS